MPEELPPTAIDAAFVPRLREQVVTIPVASEALLYEEDTGVLHQLDPIATMVCALFDGTTSVATAVDELDAVFEAEREQIAADVLAMVVRLGRLGLLDGVAADPDAADTPDEADRDPW